MRGRRAAGKASDAPTAGGVAAGCNGCRGATSRFGAYGESRLCALGSACPRSRILMFLNQTALP